MKKVEKAGGPSVSKSMTGDGLEAFEGLLSFISQNKSRNWRIANSSLDECRAKARWELIQKSKIKIPPICEASSGFAQWTNVAGQFFEEHCLLIDIDSLLFKLLLDENLTWSNGGQHLHLVYLCEKFVDIFTQRRVLVEVVAFRDQQWMWPASLRLARWVLIVHFQRHLKANVRLFEHSGCEEFVNFVALEEPTFIFIAQGHCLKKHNMWNAPIDVALFYLNKLQVTCLRLGLNTADLDDINIELNRICAFHTESSRSNKIPQNEENPLLENSVTRKLLQSLQPPTVSTELVTECVALTKDVREAVLLVALNSVLLESPADLDPDMLIFCEVLLLYVCVVERVPLNSRSLPVMETNLWHVKGLKCYEKLLNTTWEKACVILQHLTNTDLEISWKSLPDLWDGNLFSHVVEKHRAGVDFGPAVGKRLGVLSQLIEKLSGFVLVNTPLKHLSLNLPRRQDLQIDAKLELFGPLDIQLLREYTGQENFVASDGLTHQNPRPGRYGRELCNEEHHSHSFRLLANEAEKDTWQAQTYARYLRGYGESLEGIIENKRILFAADATEKDEEEKLKSSGGARKKASGIQKKRMEQKAAERERREMEKRMKEEKEDEKKWKALKETCREAVDTGNWEKAKQLSSRFSCVSVRFSLKLKVYRAKLAFERLKCEAGKLIQNPAGVSRPPILMDLALDVFLLVRDLLELPDMGGKVKKKIRVYLETLGLDSLADEYKLPRRRDWEKASEITCLLHGKETICPAEFQLLYAGPHLKREERSDPDCRVTSFIPDTWQRSLFDCIDANQSVLIAAPTSSGKTYAAYYCMERVLHDDNDGIAVYVAPNKALVNQVNAAIYARFGATYQAKQKPGTTVTGIFTRDYRNNETCCRILVTVPQCLELLILSPSQRSWLGRVRYVICDEVHCMGAENDLGGQAWENILLGIHCPFVALSATIQDPQQLRDWLQKVEDFKNVRHQQSGSLRTRRIDSKDPYQVQLIEHTTRYSDLKKYVFFSQPDPKLVPIHPVGLVTNKLLQEFGNSSSRRCRIALSAQESLQLYSTMVANNPESDSLEELAPGKYFRRDFLTRQQVRDYETALQTTLRHWACHGNLESAKNVRYELQLPPVDDNVNLPFDFVRLVKLLRSEEKLPVIVFCFDRTLCETLVGRLVNYLEKSEAKSPQYEAFLRKQDEKERRMKLLKKKRDRPAEAVRGKPVDPDEDDQDVYQSLEPDAEPNHLLDKPPLVKFSFAGQGIISRSDKVVNYFVKRAVTERHEKTLPNGRIQVGHTLVDDLYLRALRRGISWHHAGLSRTRKSLTEMLFRRKFLRVVVATSTLALGIHMPCRTVVFAQDSPFLNPQEFQQMSGRAGRRGFDLEGNVVFCGIPRKKIAQLVTGNLPRMIGHMPVNEIHVLRLLLLTASKYKSQQEAQAAVDSALSMLRSPMLVHNNPELEAKLKLHFYFVLQFLARESLINDKGQPIGLAGLVVHLHYHGAGALILASWLQQGLFHQLVNS